MTVCTVTIIIQLYKVQVYSYVDYAKILNTSIIYMAKWNDINEPGRQKGQLKYICFNTGLKVER